MTVYRYGEVAVQNINVPDCSLSCICLVSILLQDVSTSVIISSFQLGKMILELCLMCFILC